MENRFVEDYDPTIEGTLVRLARTHATNANAISGREVRLGPPPHTNVVADDQKTPVKPAHVRACVTER